MKICCKNVGILRDAEIEIKAITVIAGYNGTGKSTFSRSLFCLFNSFYKFDERLANFKKNELQNILRPFYPAQNRLDSIISELLSFKDFDEKEILTAFKNNPPQKISNLVNMPNMPLFKYLWNLDKEKTSLVILAKRIGQEFNGQIHNIYGKEKTTEINLTIKDKNLKVSVNKDVVDKVHNADSLWANVTYVDDPFIIDFLNTGLPHNFVTHKKDLLNKLQNEPNEFDEVIKENLRFDELKNILGELNEMCGGHLQMSNKTQKFEFVLNDNKESLQLENMSAGLKVMAILQKLLSNGSIEKGGTIIFDEPEIHLHPLWQKNLAKILVALQKKYGLHILITAHSFDFINAIDSYSEIMGIRNVCRFYLTELDEKTHWAGVQDVSEDLSPIYRKFNSVIQEIDDEVEWYEHNKKNAK